MISYMDWAFSKRVPARQKAVLLTVAYKCNSAGVLVEELATLGRLSGANGKLLETQLERLAEAKLIEYFVDDGVISIELKGFVK